MFIEEFSTIHIYSFYQRILFRKLGIIPKKTWKHNIPIGYWWKWLPVKMVYCRYKKIKICHENDKFLTTVYRKPIFSSIFTNFKSFTSDIYKCGLFQTLIDKNVTWSYYYEYSNTLTVSWILSEILLIIK